MGAPAAPRKAVSGTSRPAEARAFSGQRDVRTVSLQAFARPECGKANAVPDDATDVYTTVSGRLEVLTEGPAHGRALVFHSGTPSAALPFRPLTEVARAQGLRLITWSRPGYGGSEPAPGRSVADVASDTTGSSTRSPSRSSWPSVGPGRSPCAGVRRPAARTLQGGSDHRQRRPLPGRRARLDGRHG